MFAAIPHPVRDHIFYPAGTPELVEFSSRNTHTLTLLEEMVLGSDTGHEPGEKVTLSTGESLPNVDGGDDAFYLPPDPGFCLVEMIDLVRAAGVSVEVVNQR